jgi:2-polyprenyl-3-methyl-5-hydroxy-6-metoxy-1,4-benzoquinol methylase
MSCEREPAHEQQRLVSLLCAPPAAEQDIAALLARTQLRPDARILEIGCGWGRHAFALAQRGFAHVTSIDIALEPLALARALAREDGLRCDFQQQDFMAAHNGPYDAVASSLTAMAATACSSLRVAIWRKACNEYVG